MTENVTPSALTEKPLWRTVTSHLLRSELWASQWPGLCGSPDHSLADHILTMCCAQWQVNFLLGQSQLVASSACHTIGICAPLLGTIFFAFSVIPSEFLQCWMLQAPFYGPRVWFAPLFCWSTFSCGFFPCEAGLKKNIFELLHVWMHYSTLICDWIVSKYKTIKLEIILHKILMSLHHCLLNFKVTL